MKSIHSAMLATSLLGCLSAQAGSETAVPAEASAPASTATGLLLGKFPGETAYDKIWSAFTLYKDDNNPILQEFSLQGRLQVQYADGDSDGHFDIEDFKNGTPANAQSVWGDHFEARRAIFGFKSKWYQNWKFDGQVNVDTTEGASNLYRDIYELYIAYAPNDAFNLLVGKREVNFGRERETSSKEIVTFERSLVTELLFPGELTGIRASGKDVFGHWLYEAGLFSNERSREFSNFDEGALVFAKAGYDFSEQADLDTAIVQFEYMYNSDPGAKVNNDDNFFASASPAFTNSIGLSSEINKGRFGLTTDMLYGFGFDGSVDQAGSPKVINQSDVFGISIIPTYFVADGLQLVGRFQWATGGDAGPGTSNLGLPNRYEKWAPGTIQNGESYTSFYFGVNYYIYGNKLKLMNGIEYSIMDGGLAKKGQTNDFDGYTFFSGLRFYF